MAVMYVHDRSWLLVRCKQKPCFSMEQSYVPTYTHITHMHIHARTHKQTPPFCKLHIAS